MDFQLKKCDIYQLKKKGEHDKIVLGQNCTKKNSNEGLIRMKKLLQS